MDDTPLPTGVNEEKKFLDGVLFQVTGIHLGVGGNIS